MSIQALFKGFGGELKTRFFEKILLDSKQYHVFNNIIIPSNLGTTQIDHIVISRFGIFVIETKDKGGWIYGGEKQDQWTQVIYKSKYKFQNPLRQNYLHTKSLAQLLDVEHSKIFSLIVFWGQCEFKTPMPQNVLRSDFTGYIKSKAEVLLSEQEVDLICQQLKAIKDGTSFFAGFQHTQDLKKRHQVSPICPRCGGDLVKRQSSKGNNDFWGCEKFPKCRYTKRI